MNFNEIFPADIISEILSRLPTDLVLRCKLVCKLWMSLIHNRSFRLMHLTRLNHPDSTDYGKFRYVFLNEEKYVFVNEEEVVADDDDDYKHLYYFEINDNEGRNHVRPICRNINFNTPFDEKAYTLIGSINGLICIYGLQPNRCRELHTVGPAIIFNPVTREYTVLPELDSIRYTHLACGFGYIAERNEYKVVRIYHLVDEPGFLVEVYTVGSDKGWRHVGKFCFSFEFDADYTNGVFLNGCFHWRNMKGGMVLVFDLAAEKFRNHIPPPPMGHVAFDFNYPVIGISGGGILYYAVCGTRGERGYSAVWLFMKKNDNHVTKEHEEHQSWGWSRVSSLDPKEPFAFSTEGFCLRYSQGTMFKFDVEDSAWFPVLNAKVISCLVFPHKDTLVSLKDLGEEIAQIMGNDFEDTNSFLMKEKQKILVIRRSNNCRGFLD